MKRLAMVLALVAMGACQKAEQKPAAQAPADTSKMAQMPMADTSKHMMMADTSKKMAAPVAPAAPAAKPAPKPTKKP